MMHYPTIKDNADLEFFYTPQCKVRKLAKNRDTTYKEVCPNIWGKPLF